MRPKYKELYNKQIRKNESLQTEIEFYKEILEYMMKKDYIRNYIYTTIEELPGVFVRAIRVIVDKDFEQSICITQEY